MVVKGFVDFENNFLWNKDVLGKTYEILIKENKYNIHFPKIPNEWNNKNENLDHILHFPLEAPQITNEFRKGTDKIIYGYPVSYPSGVSSISLISVSFNTEKNIDLKSKILYDNIEEWLNNFFKIIKIISNYTATKTKINDLGESLELYLDDDKLIRIPNTNEIEFQIVETEDEEAITDDIVKKAINLLNNKFIIPDAYVYYLTAMEAYEDNNYRNCILDCSTAAEISVTNRILNYCDKNEIVLSNNKLSYYKGLESKSKLLVFLKDNPKINFSLISKPRNKAIHSGDKISHDETKLCLNETKKLIDYFQKFY